MSAIPFLKGLHGYSHRLASDDASSPGGGEQITQEHFEDEVDINTIVSRFGLTGQFPSSVTRGVYGDFSGISDYESAVETIDRTRARFMLLPPQLREQFDNDPGELVKFAATHSVEDLEALSAAPVVDPAPAPVDPVV